MNEAPTVARPADIDAMCALVGAIPSREGRRAVIALDGPSGSGKSTLAFALGAALGEAYVLQSDTYHVPLDVAYRMRPTANLAGAMIDWRRMRREVLAEAQSDLALTWTWQNLFDDAMVVQHVVPSGHDLIIDGTFSCRPELWDLYDVRILVTCGAEVSADRRRARDSGMPEEWKRYVEQTWVTDESVHIASLNRSAFDLVIATD